MNRLQMLRNSKGIATVETLPLLLVFVILLAYGLGSFGVIHTGILNSIAARTYAFETFRNRTNTVYFRERGALQHYQRMGGRVHGISNEAEPSADLGFRATARPLRVGFGGLAPDPSANSAEVHERLHGASGVVDGVQTSLGVSPVWIKTQYGLCIDARCGD